MNHWISVLNLCMSPKSSRGCDNVTDSSGGNRTVLWGVVMFNRPQTLFVCVVLCASLV